ncbi:PilZ domain-containing protein [Desulfobacterota bacterium M19]
MSYEMPCWKIMACPESRPCAAREHQDRPCWDVARDYKRLQHKLGVCEDCLVYLLKTQPDELNGAEIAAVFACRFPSSAPCPLLTTTDRRRERRFKLQNHALAFFIHNSSPQSMPIIDISRAGMSFTSMASIADRRDKLTIAIKHNGGRFSLPAVIVASVNSQSSRCQRYGVKFGNLSAIQLNALDNLLLKHGKAA